MNHTGQFNNKADEVMVAVYAKSLAPKGTSLPNSFDSRRTIVYKIANGRNENIDSINTVRNV